MTEREEYSDSDSELVVAVERVSRVELWVVSTDPVSVVSRVELWDGRHGPALTRGLRAAAKINEWTR